MVLLVKKLGKQRSKLENFHHHHSREDKEALLAALGDFKSRVLGAFNLLVLNAKDGSKILSFSWIKRAFDLVEKVNKHFARLIVAIDYPISSWMSGSVDEYLDYSLFMLDSLNSISSGISQISHSRILLLHASSLSKTPGVVIKPLNPIEIKISTRKTMKHADDGKHRFCSGKEAVIHDALILVKTINFWVCGAILSGFCGEPKHYLEIKELVFGSSCSPLEGLDSSEVEVLEEVKDVNDAVASLASDRDNGEWRDEITKVLRRRLTKLEKVMEDIEKMVNQLFFRTLADRDQLINTLRIT